MAGKKTAAEATVSAVSGDDSVISLGALLSKQRVDRKFRIWLVGDTPLITHAWSEKAKREMLGKQVKATKPGKEARDPQADFVASLYDLGDGTYGFPAMGVKNCIVGAAHKDKGLAKTTVQSAIWLDADMHRVRPALSGAICDMPMIRIWGDDPAMREDMVKIGAGLNKTASLAYRGQFTNWAMQITGRFNTTTIAPEAFAFLIQEAGTTSGLGEWRNERKGMFGAFHLADAAEEAAWDAFAAGTGPLPVRHENLQMAAE